MRCATSQKGVVVVGIGSSFSSSVCFYKDDLPSSEAPSATTCDLEVVKTAGFIFVHTFQHSSFVEKASTLFRNKCYEMSRIFTRTDEQTLVESLCMVLFKSFVQVKIVPCLLGESLSQPFKKGVILRNMLMHWYKIIPNS